VVETAAEESEPAARALAKALMLTGSAAQQSRPALGLEERVRRRASYCNQARMRPAERLAMGRAEDAACGADGLNQELPVTEVSASPW